MVNPSDSDYFGLGYTDDPSCSPQFGSHMSFGSDSLSFKSFKSDADFDPPILGLNVGTDLFPLPQRPKSFREPKSGSGSIATPGSDPNQHPPFFSRLNDSENSPPKSSLTEFSFHSFDFTPDETKNRMHSLTDSTNLPVGFPATSTSFDSIFKPAVDKNLSESCHLPILDGYIQVQSPSLLAMPPGTDSAQKSRVPNLNNHSPINSPSNRTPTSHVHRNTPIPPRHPLEFASDVSGSDCFVTAPTSPVSDSCNLSEIAHPTPSRDTDAHRLHTPNLPNLTLVNTPPNLPQLNQTIAGNDKASGFVPRSPQRSASFLSPHPRANKPPPRMDPVHDGTLLTSAMDIAINEAVALFEATRWDRTVISPSSAVSILRLTF